jgi:hypothetical protein
LLKNNKQVTEMDQDQVKQNILSGHQWLRMLFMLGYILASWVLVLVLLAVVLVQTLIVLIVGETNHNLRRFGIVCGVFMHQIIHFLVYGSDDKPFPFSDFPDMDRIDTSDRVTAEDVPKYSYEASGARNSQTAAATPDYEEIIPSTHSVHADDDFPAVTDADHPERLS